MDLEQQYCGAPTIPPPPSRLGAPNFGDALTWHCSPRYKKHAENITIHLERLNRVNVKDAAAVLGKQVLMLDEKKI